MKNRVFISKDHQLYRGEFGLDCVAQVGFNKNNGRAVFLPSDYDISEFGEDVYRIETALSSSKNSENRFICRIDSKKGRISFLDDDEYLEGNIKWGRFKAVDYLTIADKSAGKFKLETFICL